MKKAALKVVNHENLRNESLTVKDLKNVRVKGVIQIAPREMADGSIRKVAVGYVEPFENKLGSLMPKELTERAQAA